MSADDRGSAFQFYLRGVRGALTLPAWVIGVSMIGIGTLARDVGYPLAAAMVSTIVIWAGPAQVVYFSMVGAGASLAAIALAVTLTAIRLLPMVASLMPYLRSGGASRGKLLLASHFVAVTSWVEAMRRLPAMPVEARLPYFLGFGSACLGAATFFTAVGYLLAARVPPAMAAGMLFMTPAFFTLSLFAGARVRADWLAVGLGFALTPLFGVWLGPAPALFLGGVIGGTAAFLWQRGVGAGA